MRLHELMNSDSKEFWKWWNSKNVESEFRPYIMEVKSSARWRGDRF